MRGVCLLLLIVLLQGCMNSTRDEYADDKVVGTLVQKRAPVEIRSNEKLVTDREQVRRHYRALLEKRLAPSGSSVEKALTVEASRRVADFELEQQQEKLFAEDADEKAIEQATLKPAIERYENLLSTNPDYKNNDRILYQLARAYGNTGQTEQAHQSLSRLVQTYPKSEHFLEAQFRRAEYLFLHRAYAEATEAYRSIVEVGAKAQLHNRIRYKLAWSLYKQQQLGEALDTYIQLLDSLLLESGNKGLDSDNGLLRDTLRIASLSFSLLGGEQAVGRYFATHGRKPYEYMIYQELAEQYQEQGRNRDSAQTYLAFVLLDPTHPQAPQLQLKEIDVYHKAGFIEKTLSSKKAFIKRYRNDGKNWQQLLPNNRELVNQHLHLTLLELANEAHATAQQLQKSKKSQTRQKRQQSLDEATHWYRTFIQLFPQGEQTGRVNFLLAELLFDQQKYSQAMSEYEKAAYSYPEHEKSAEAGYALLLTIRKLGRNAAADAKRGWQQRGIISAVRFADEFPNDVRRAEVMLNAAEALFSLADHEQAIAVAQRVIQQQKPAVKAALQLSAWKVVAHANFEQEAFAAAEQAYKQVLQRLPRKSRQRKAFVERLAASIYKQGEKERLAGKHEHAAAHFLRIAAETPRASIRVTANYDAALSFIANNAWQQAIGVLETFERNYPTYKLMPDVRKNLALGYIKTEQPLKAAALYSQIAKKNNSPEMQREASWQAAELYQQSGAAYDAVRAYKYYVRTFPKPISQGLEGREQLVTLYQKLGETAKRDYWLRKIILVDKEAGKSRTDRSRYLAAKASYTLSEPLFDTFMDVELRIPLRKSLKKKKLRMKAAIKAYSQLAEYQVAEYTTLATFRMAKIYQHLGQSLMKSDRPNGLNEEELEQYEMLLEEQAYPFEEKAMDIYQANTERTTIGIYDEWVKRSFAELATLNPVRYAKEERLVEVVYALQ